MSKILTVRHLNKAFEVGTCSRQVLSDLSFSLEEGSITAVMAASGAGKTTLLRILLGLETADSGEICWGEDAREVTSARQVGAEATREVTEARQVGAEATRGLAAASQADSAKPPRLSAVFQEDRLCENLSPVSNIRLVTGNDVSREEILQALAALGLSDTVHQPVRQLSGGQRRRVALLRALLAPWDLLLLDEPFKGLDGDAKKEAMNYVLARVRAGFHKGQLPDTATAESLPCGNCVSSPSAPIYRRTVLLVTHDPEEAEYMADKILHI